MMVKGFECWK